MTSAQEREHMQRLAEALSAKVGRDECGAPCIAGRRGNIHRDGQGYSLAVMLSTRRAWIAAQRRLLAFCRIVAEGDSEAVLHMPQLPGRREAAIVRAILQIPKRRRAESAAHLQAYRFPRLQEDFPRARTTISTPMVSG